jgi:transketolase
MAEGTAWNVYDANKMASKEVYGRVLAELAKDDPRIVGVTADLAKSTNIQLLGDAYPERLINVGIAEQNLIGVAAGLAKAGFIPFASTFAAFAALRGVEFFRTDCCYQKLPVKMLATHGGLSFGTAGTTHHCTEDIAIMRAIPNCTVVLPADGYETAKAVKACIPYGGPFYMRIGRGFEPPLHADDNFEFEIGKARIEKDGSDMAIIACGFTVRAALEAAKLMEANDGVSIRVINMHTLKPIDEKAVMDALFQCHRRILTVEEHNIIGGLGDAVASVIATSNKACVFKKLGIPDAFSVIGKPEDLYYEYKIDTQGVLETVREMMKIEAEADEDWSDED